MRNQKMGQISGQGKGWRGDSAGHAEAGRKGGQTTFKEHGEEFYSRIGEKGGSVSPGNFKYDTERARRAGRKGGKARRGI